MTPTQKWKLLAAVLSVLFAAACQKPSILENPGVPPPEAKEPAPVLPSSAALQEQGVALFRELALQKKFDDFHRAFELLDQAVKEDPNNHLALASKGGLLLSLRRYHEAADAFAAAAQIRPQSGEYYMGRAIALQRTGDEGGAKEACRHAVAAFSLRLKKTPDDPARVDRAMAVYLLGEKETALGELEAVLKARPDDVAALESKNFIASNPADPWGFLGF